MRSDMTDHATGGSAFPFVALATPMGTMGTRSRLAATVLSALLIAGCTGDDDAGPPSTPPAPSTSVTTASTIPASTSTSTSSTTTTTTTTTLPPTTTTMPGTATVAATCATLQTASWPERRAVILVNTAAYQAEGGAGALVDPVRATCPDDLARQEAAVAMEQRMAATVTGLDEQRQSSFSSSGCQDGNIVTTYTNGLAEPVGLAIGALAYADDDTPLDAVDNVSVVWSMTPSQALLLTIPYGPGPGGCAWLPDHFLGDTGPVDAALPGGPGPATTGDDPAVWLPALIQAVLDTATAPTEAGWADVQDVRLLRPLDTSLEPATDIHPLVSATVCPGTVDQPDPDHIAFAYRTEYGPSVVDGVEHAGFASLRFNAFRRGSDGRWRQLMGPYPLNGSLMGADCGPIVPHG